MRILIFHAIGEIVVISPEAGGWAGLNILNVNFLIGWAGAGWAVLNWLGLGWVSGLGRDEGGASGLGLGWSRLGWMGCFGLG